MNDIAKLATILDDFTAIGYSLVNAAETMKSLLPELEKAMPDKEPAPAAQVIEEKKYTFQEVRGIMATLAAQGKKAEAKGLLTKYCANRLSEIKEEDYAALVKEAEAILDV